MGLLKNKLHLSTGQELRPGREALISLSLAFIISISPHLGRLPVWFAALAILVFSWRYKIITARWHQPGKFIRFIIIFCVISLVFRHYQTLLGRDAGVSMLVALTMLKFLELNSLRDYMLVVFLCLFIALTSFLYSQSMVLGAYLMLVVIFLFAVMMYLNHSQKQGVQSIMKRSAVLVLTALPIAILLFVLFPRMQGGLISLPGDSHAGLSGLSDSMKPGSINELNLSEKVAFRVEFSGQVPAQQQRYWRGIVLEIYEDGEWKEVGEERQGAESSVNFSSDKILEYSILQEPSNKKWVFALDMPVQKPADLKWGPGHTLRSSGQLRDRRQMQLTSVLDYSFADISERELVSNFDISAVNGERIMELARTLYQQSGSDRSYIKTVMDYYRNNNFIYSLQPPRLGENPVDSFMLDTRKGYCEHFASSFTVMMRLAGIPARVVTGYQGGEWNEQGNYMIVRQSDAHAWSEVWLDGTGWTRVDPTSAVSPERIEYGLDAIRQLIEQGQQLGTIPDEQIKLLLDQSFLVRSIKGMRMFWDGVNTSWYRWVIGYGKENQLGLLKWLGFSGAYWRDLIIILIALVTFLLLLQSWLLFHRKRVVDPSLARYQKFCKHLARVGIQRQASEGPFRFAQRVCSLRPDLQTGVMMVTNTYIDIVYAGNSGELNQQKLAKAVRLFKPGKLKT